MMRRSLSLLIIVAACAAQAHAAGQNAPAPAAVAATPAPMILSELVKTDTVVGTGAEAKAGSKVSVHYTGWLYQSTAKDLHGKKFDSSHDRGQPISFTLGTGRVIRGWDKGVEGMKVGGKRTLMIPSQMAYGAQAKGDVIPANSDLIFDVQLMDVK